MDFQELLNIAAENNKRAQKEASASKHYTTRLPPPKKEKRTGVDRAAIRARLDKKQQEIQQKASKEQAKKQQLLKLRAESKQKGKKTAEKPTTSGRPQSDTRKHDYKDEKHEQRHQSFIKKVQHVAERTRKEEPKPVSKVTPDWPKKPKKRAATPKGPMSYEQLLALATNQQKGDSKKDSKPKTSKDARVDKEPSAKQHEQWNRKQDGVAVKKALAARKLGEARRKEFLERRRNSDAGAGSTSSGKKTQGTTTNGVTPHPHRTNGKVVPRPEKQGIRSGAKKPETVTSRPAASTAKTKKQSAAGTSRPQPRIAGSRSNGADENSDRTKQRKQELERKRPPGKLHQSRDKQYSDRKPVGDRPRIVPQQRSPPRRQSKLDSYYDRAPSGSRSQPGRERRAPSTSGQVPRKRPAPTAPPSFSAKHGRLLSEEDSDYEDDGFIDDTPLEEEGGEDVSRYIKEIFGYDKSKYEHVSDYQLRNMEASFREVQQEEARTARLGMREDLEDMRREQDEKRLKLKATAKKRRR